MGFCATEFSLEGSIEIWEMLKEIGPGENGFKNTGYNIPYERLTGYLQYEMKMARGLGLKPAFATPSFWIFQDDLPIGIGRVKHYLNDPILRLFGQIAFCIRPSERGKGYANTALSLILQKAKEKGVAVASLTCAEENMASRKAIEFNEGKLEKIENNECYYWIALS